MKRPLLFLFGLMSLYVANAQNYNNIVNYFFNGTPVNGVKIKTNLPFTNQTQMPTIHIYGYNYGSGNGSSIDLTLVYYIFNGAFVNYGISSAGNYTPPVSLSTENGNVVIFINDRQFFQRFTVSVYANGMSETPGNFQGWTVADETLTGTNTVVLPYKNTFGGDVSFTGGIWNNAGNVGIGTSSPGQKLEVNGHVQVDGQVIAPNGGFRVWSNTGDTLNNAPWYGLGNSNLALPSGQGYGAVQLAGFWGLNFRTGSGQIVMTNAGNVGIGTAKPTAKLAVAGNIQAYDVMVQTGWADYVFDSAYDLRPLTSIASYIQQNKHLPNIPSAEEVAKNGIALGEMNKKLLEKVEELTLYLISQNEKVKKQEEESKQQKEQIKTQNETTQQLKDLLLKQSEQLRNQQEEIEALKSKIK